MTLPPDSFYYVLSFLFGCALIWILKIAITKIVAIFEKLSEAVADLRTMVAVHEHRHDDAERRLYMLEGNGKNKKK